MIVLVLGALGFAQSVKAQSAVPSSASIMDQVDRDTIDSLRAQADFYREQAQKEQRRAEDYKELEANARQYAKTARTKKDRDQWLQDAQERADKIKQLEASAQAYRARAEKQDRKADAMEQGLSERAAEQAAKDAAWEAEFNNLETRLAAEEALKRNDDSCQFRRATDLVGLWHYEGNEEADAFAIVQQNPDAVGLFNALELHNFDRKWSGTFNPDPDLPKTEPRLTFKYKPQPKEMNPEIPDWAQAAIDTKLEWEMEIWAECEGGATMPYALFYPGEVKWNEDSERVEIVGRGEARRLNFVPRTVMLADYVAGASIAIDVGGGHDPYVHPAEALTKRQRFSVQVRLPSAMAEEIGGSLDVTFKGLSNNDSDTITLTAGADRGKYHFVSYTHTDFITIADSNDFREADRNPQFFSIPWLLSQTGDRIDLDVENGESVQVSYKDLSFEIPVYNSWVQRGLVRYEEAAAQLTDVFSAIIAGPYSQAQKEAAHLRMRLIVNYRLLSGSDVLNDLHRYELGRVYFGTHSDGNGLVHLGDTKLKNGHQRPRDFRYKKGDDGLNAAQKGFIEGLTGESADIKSDTAGDDIAWVSELERQQVLSGLWNVSRRKREELIQTSYKNLSFALYQDVMAMTWFDDVYVVVSGKDAFNKKVKGWERVLAAVGLGSQAVLRVSSASSFYNRFYGDQRRRFGLPHPSQATFKAQGSKTAAPTPDALIEPKTPPKLSAAQHQQTFVRARPKTADDGPPVSCLFGAADDILDDLPRDPVTGRVLSFEEAIEALRQPVVTPQTAKYLKKRYPKSAKLVEDYSDTYKAQGKRPNCQAKTFEWILRKRTGKSLDEDELHRLIMSIGLAELEKNPKLPVAFGFGYVTGYPNWMIKEVAEQAFSFRVSEISGKMAARSRTRSFKVLLDGGASVKVSLDFGKNRYGKPLRHAVSIEGVDVNTKGFATKVRLFDPNVAGIIELPAKDFEKLFVFPSNNVSVVTIFR